MGLFLAMLFVAVPFAEAEANTTHTVQRGESLYLISQKYGVTVPQLQQANGISGTIIYVGQSITIPSTSSGSGVHTVTRGETLYIIAQKYGVTYQDIMRQNNLSSTVIYPGQQLRIPIASTVADRGAVRSGNGNVSAADLDLLARIISAEAQGESYTTQVAVGAVVLNRVKHRDFPNTISGVIYDRSNGYYQFTPVMNGWINRPATDSAKRAAQDAVNGWDPTNGAIYFFESWVTNQWLQSRPFAAKIGAFTFTY
ncbi:LysM peptidoglycan-binding domain-containing protein [Desulfofalx alkaliphila]|uniref:LysM peptidoglycan-binding domain-containing protein n=1 Tax=Desulfofalx alkaliphila TaxID=105483 RepID=UPI001EE472FA|nr:LysM peptidoglycan-binding domain-containing protein [Desulfofalx alkaliphila]